MAFAVARRGGDLQDYWDLATVPELACIGNDWASAGRVFREDAAARESFMPKTTADNLELLKQARQRQGQEPPQVDEFIATAAARTEWRGQGEGSAGKPRAGNVRRRSCA